MATEIKSFEDFKLNRQLLNAISEAGYAEPTEIQQAAIPLTTSGHDLLGIAQTGTGKTAAFVLPLLMKIKYPQGNDPRAVILAPTRELVMQIDANISELAKYTEIRHVPLYGGQGPKRQKEAVEAGVDIIVATPGRFLDIYKTGAFNTKQIKTMILDEADKMMDMGFMPQIRNILEIIPTKRQNLLFSATFPPRVEELSHEFLEFPEKVEIAPQATTVDTVQQQAFKVPNFRTKIEMVGHFLKEEEVFKRVIIFANTRTTADNIFKFIERKVKGTVKVIHANKGQNTRINAMEEFKSGNVRVLVTTDVSARGIDVSEVSHVINFDVPPIYEDYVHRIGRTGRAKAVGNSITFINPAEEYHFKKIEELIQMEVPLAEIPESVKIFDTPKEEQQGYLRHIDDLKKKEDPNFKGAFHEKKRVIQAREDKERRRNTGNAFSNSSRGRSKGGGKNRNRSGSSRNAKNRGGGRGKR
ncbi:MULTISPECIES: DEAD/DEAH box helicase [Persicobacter]|uniref:DEAD/DEAH box helicase n=1 Tax=Persicobacter diffluens TaxID=981 RepID=A0AAN5AI36_9BACT|nr:DEAD/DEAH box helicase [Persicobacter sp. CCB-QB2]GJM59995.1 DEAD/DEAH box helicase [Persicobacter diffluens]